MNIFALLILLGATAPRHRAARHPRGCAPAVAPRAIELPAAGGSATKPPRTEADDDAFAREH